MTGASENYKHRGLIPRTISHMFKEISDRNDLSFIVRVSYLEIYNEQMIDLLGSNQNEGINDYMSVVEDKIGTLYLTLIQVPLM
jgi:kinesin family protein 6/9